MTNKPRVAMITPRYAPAIGGIERYVENIALGLCKRGVALDILCTDPAGTLPRHEIREGVSIYRFPTLAHDSVYYLSPAFGWWLLKNAHRYTLFHAHSYHAPLALQAGIVAALKRIPLIFNPYYHGTGHTMFRRLLHVPYQLPGNWLMRRASQLICISSSEQQLVEARFRPKRSPIVILPGFDNPPRENTNADDEESATVIILSVGRLEHYKRVDHLIAALPFLPENFQVVVIGDGDARAKLEMSAAPFRKRARFYGYVSDSELQRWMRRAHVFVTLSEHESFGLTVAEAAMQGIPVVASNIPAHKEVSRYLPAGRVALLDLSNSAQQIAAAIQAATVGKRTADVSGWQVPTWEEAAERTLAVYEATLERKAGHPRTDPIQVS